MKIEQRIWDRNKGWNIKLPYNSSKTQLLLIFGAKECLLNEKLLQQIKEAYPNALLFGCSTAGEIIDTRVYDNTIILTAVNFESTLIKSSYVRLQEVDNSFRAGEKLAGLLPAKIFNENSSVEENLFHIIVLSDGLKVNGSDLVKGLSAQLPPEVTITGGLAGDSDRFQETFVIGEDRPQTGIISALGLYGSKLKVGFSSFGGWDSFGQDRLITKSKGNVLYELNGQSALELYKKYLGEHAKDLPASALLFPLSLRSKSEEQPLVRTILSIDEKEQSMTYAGDVPEGSYARFMKANIDRLIDGAVSAAKMSCKTLGSQYPELALLISCVGRKLIMKQRIEEEVEGVREVMGNKTTLTGFYSYGEISPFARNEKCELHNQSMTITTLLEE